jgi:hypothetical protein
VWEVDTHVSRQGARVPAPWKHRKQPLSSDQKGTQPTMTRKLRRIALAATAPGKIFVGTIFKGEHFHVDRTVRVKSGSAKGVWHHGKRIATNPKNGKTYVVTGWIPASAFCA